MSKSHGILVSFEMYNCSSNQGASVVSMGSWCEDVWYFNDQGVSDSSGRYFIKLKMCSYSQK